MAFVLPTFNLNVNVWRHVSLPHSDPPAVTCMGQLRGPSQTSATVNPTDGLAAGNYLLVPKLTDIRDASTPSNSDYVEVPAGSGRFYQVLNVDDIAKGFTNEHRYVIITKLLPWPQPIP